MLEICYTIISTSQTIQNICQGYVTSLMCVLTIGKRISVSSFFASAKMNDSQATHVERIFAF